MADSNAFKFFLNSSPGEIKEKDNSSLEYIIAQNDFFHHQVEELKKEMNSLITEKNIFEEENERYEKSMVALRGITYNEYEMCKLLEEVLQSYKNTTNGYKKHQKQYREYTKNYYIVILVFYLLQYFLSTLGYNYLLLFFYSLGGVLIFGSYHLNKKIKGTVIGNVYVSKENRYLELRKNQDYVGKMIDNM